MRRENMKMLWIWMILLLVSTANVIAQEETTCPTEIPPVELVTAECATTDRNQACYTYSNITLNDQQPESFNTTGKIISVNDIQTLELQGGIAFLRLQANFVADMPEQNVNLLAWGDMIIQNNISIPNIGAITTSNARVRNVPFAESDMTVIAVIPANITVSILGRNEDSSWFYISLGDYAVTGSTEGWTSRQVLSFSGDINSLPIIDYQNPPTPSIPMSDITITTNAPPCTDAPTSGILIQTAPDIPSGILIVNGISIAVRGTALLTKGVNTLNISLLEGQGVIMVNNEQALLIGGTMTSVPLGDDNLANDVPSETIAYPSALVEGITSNFVAVLAMLTEIPTPIRIAEPFTSENISQSIQTIFAPNGLYEGVYKISYSLSCTPSNDPRQTTPIADTLLFTSFIRIEGDELVLDNGTPSLIRVPRVGGNEFSYTESYSIDGTGITSTGQTLQTTTTMNYQYTIITPTQIRYTMNGENRYPIYPIGSQFASGEFATSICAGNGIYEWVTP
jgi:hypothetical protein